MKRQQLADAREAVRSSLQTELAQGRCHLGRALATGYAAALGALADDDGLVDPAHAMRLAAAVPWPDEPFSVDKIEDVFDEMDPVELDEVLVAVVDGSETLADWDDDGISFMSSGSASLKAFTLGDAVYTYAVFDDPELGESHEAERSHARGDEAGRRAMFVRAVDEHLGGVWGRLDVTLGAGFPKDLIPSLRAAAEEGDGAPWATDRLELSVPTDEDEIEHCAPRLAKAVGVTTAEAVDILRHLGAHPDEEPPTAQHRAAAWWLAEDGTWA